MKLDTCKKRKTCKKCKYFSKKGLCLKWNAKQIEEVIRARVQALPDLKFK